MTFDLPSCPKLDRLRRHHLVIMIASAVLGFALGCSSETGDDVVLQDDFTAETNDQVSDNPVDLKAESAEPQPSQPPSPPKAEPSIGSVDTASSGEPIDVRDIVGTDQPRDSGIDKSKFKIRSDNVGFGDLINGKEPPQRPAPVNEPPRPVELKEPPSPENVAKNLAVIENFFKVSAAETPAQKAKLAKRLFTTGRHAASDATAQYALLTLTSELAAEGGDLQLALASIDELNQQFAIDAAGRKLNIVDAVSQSPETTPETKRELLEASRGLIAQLYQANQHDTARRLAAQLLAVARDLNDVEAIARIEAANQQATHVAAMYQQSQKALAKLRTDRTDPAANHVAGSYLTFIGRDWINGPKLLQYSADKTLATVAKAEIIKPQTPAQQLKLADAWWKQAENAQAEFRPAMRARAGFWYQAGVEFFEGSDRTHAQDRLRELRAAGVDYSPSAFVAAKKEATN